MKIFFVICHVFLSVHCSLVVTCWERVKLLALLCVRFYCGFATFPCGVLGQVWCLIVSISDLCLLTYCDLGFLQFLVMFLYRLLSLILFLVYSAVTSLRHRFASKKHNLSSSKHCILSMCHWQTVQTQSRRHKSGVWSGSTEVCLPDVLLKFELNSNVQRNIH